MKIKLPFALLTISILLLLQTTLLEYVEIAGVKPNLLLTFTICAAFYAGSREGAAVGALAGLAQDMATGIIFGFYAIIGAAAGFITGLINRRLYRDNMIVLVLVTFLVTLIYESVVSLLYGRAGLHGSALAGGPAKYWFVINRLILPEAAYNCAVATALYLPVLAREKNGKIKAGGKTVTY
ncbi:MAG: rod shape-determining protein MreD [Eubacteriales bacterium]|nr:rod shape-determining protein MreD [Eubacteriales bacterium]